MKIRLKELRLLPPVMCLLIVLREVVLLYVFPSLLPVYQLVLGLCFVSLFVMTFIYMRHPFMSLFEMAAFLYCFTLIGFTLLNGTDINNAIYQSVIICLLLLLFNFYEEKIPLLLKSLTFGFSVCIYANLLIILLFPEWIFATEDTFDSFLLGSNYNQMGCRFITGIMCSMLCIKYNKLWLVNTVLLFLTSMFTLGFVGSMTSLSTILLFVVLSIIPSKSVQKISFIGLFVLYLLFHFFVVFSGEGLHNNELATYIVEDVLGKDITFTGRTSMWDSALRVIGQSPIWGYGFVDKDWYLANMSTFAIGPHNFILANLIYGGIILLFIFIAMTVFALRRLQKESGRMAVILLLCIMSLFFMMTFEVYPTFFIVLLLTLANHYPKIKVLSEGRVEAMNEMSQS